MWSKLVFILLMPEIDFFMWMYMYAYTYAHAHSHTHTYPFSLTKWFQNYTEQQ